VLWVLCVVSVVCFECCVLWVLCVVLCVVSVVCFECWVLSGSGLCDGLITRPEASYRLWCVVCVCVIYRNLVNEEALAY
jgi:hypothetical protein